MRIHRQELEYRTTADTDVLDLTSDVARVPRRRRVVAQVVGE